MLPTSWHLSERPPAQRQGNNWLCDPIASHRVRGLVSEQCGAAHPLAPWLPTLLQMAGSAGWFANDQVRLKPQSLWLLAAVISHTVSDPIIAHTHTPVTTPTSSV